MPEQLPDGDDRALACGARRPAQASLIDRVVEAIEDAYEANDHGLDHEDLARATIAAHVAYLAGPAREISGDAGHFLEELAERANAESVLDAPWWTALASMLIDGWRVLPPTKAPDG